MIDSPAVPPGIREDRSRKASPVMVLLGGLGTNLPLPRLPSKPGTNDVPGFEGPGFEGPGFEGPGFEGPGFKVPGRKEPGFEGAGFKVPGRKEPGFEGAGFKVPGLIVSPLERPLGF